jgi:hypothetical protein
LCKFGISPFSVWRNKDQDPEGSDSKAGQTNYDDLYADILLWLKNKWIDYVAPQLYWEFSHRLVPFGLLVDWWNDHAYGRHMYIGHGIYKGVEERTPAWRNNNELPNQIKKVRQADHAQGSVFYTSGSFLKNPNGWNDSLRNNYYKYPAIIPPMPWIDNTKPDLPQFSGMQVSGNNQNEIILNFSSVDFSGLVKQYAFYVSPPENTGKDIPVAIYPALKNMTGLTIRVPAGMENVSLAITAIGRTNNESESKNYNLLWSGDHWTLK